MSVTRPLIGITGHRESGKDTVGLWLETHYGYRPAAFAAAVKREVARKLCDHLSGEPYYAARDYWLAYIEDHKRDLVDGRPHWTRQIVRAWGEAVKAVRGETWWADQVLLGPGVVVTDVRFPIEERAIRAAGGLLWRVERPGCSADGDVSDAYVDQMVVDRVLRNHHDLDYLRTEVDLAALHYGGAPRLGLLGTVVSEPIP